jgi:ribonuclease HII
VYYVGVDEAGRGSLIGEMIVGVAAVKPDFLNYLEDLGVKDSKELSPSSRKRIYRTVSGSIPFVVVPVKPKEIDSDNLGVITKKAIIRGLRILSLRINPTSVKRIAIDRFGKERDIRHGIRSLGYTKADIVIEEKADRKYLEVSLASIIAKYIRDKRVSIINRMFGLAGSGYPSDEDTINSLSSLLSKTGIDRLNGYVRLTWSTLEKLGVQPLSKRKTRSLEEFF